MWSRDNLLTQSGSRTAPTESMRGRSPSVVVNKGLGADAVGAGQEAWITQQVFTMVGLVLQDYGLLPGHQVLLMI